MVTLGNHSEIPAVWAEPCIRQCTCACVTAILFYVIVTVLKYVICTCVCYVCPSLCS